MTNKGMGEEGDAFSAFAWGLRKYWWVVLAAVLILGGAVPRVLEARTADRFDASAQVGPVSAVRLRNLDALPKTVETVFGNGAVEAAVRQELQLPDSALVIPSRVELVAPQDNVVFTLVGHAETEEDAVNLANTAAGTLTEELNRYREPVGTFAVTSSAGSTVRRTEAPTPTFLALVGVATGLLVGLGLVAVLLTWRRPVLSPRTASRVTGAPVLGTVQFRGRTVDGLAPVCHGLLASGIDVVYLTGREKDREERRRLATEMQTLLLDTDLDVREGATTRELATRSSSSLTALVVPVGTADSILRREAELHLDPGSTGLVLVRRRRAGWKRSVRPFRRTPEVAASQATAPPQRPDRVGSKDSAMTSQ